MHPGWAAQAGLRAALVARHGFLGPRTVFEGTHGFFHAFGRTTAGNYAALTSGFDERGLDETLAFKLYPCGTMTHPYIDCARRLSARCIGPHEIKEIMCEVGEGTVHRLWGAANKQRPPTGAGRVPAFTALFAPNALLLGLTAVGAEFRDELILCLLNNNGSWIAARKDNFAAGEATVAAIGSDQGNVVHIDADGNLFVGRAFHECAHRPTTLLPLSLPMARQAIERRPLATKEPAPSMRNRTMVGFQRPSAYS